MAKDLDIKLDEDKIPSNLESIEILKYLEFARNLIMLCDTKLFVDNEKDSNDKYKYTYYQEYNVLKENINIVLEHLNFSTKLLKKEERIILIEKNPSAIAVAEIVDDDIGFMLNNIHIRHNNKSGKKQKRVCI